jgi:uncharacterized protein (DUF1330 family)
MAVYFIAQYQVNDPALYREYQQGAAPSIGKYGGKLVAFDVAAQTMEGEPPGPQTVILEFESEEQARSWYDSPEYQEIVGKRLRATQGFSVLARSANFG